jgi:hypothetical protein
VARRRSTGASRRRAPTGVRPSFESLPGCTGRTIEKQTVHELTMTSVHERVEVPVPRGSSPSPRTRPPSASNEPRMSTGSTARKTRIDDGSVSTPRPPRAGGAARPTRTSSQPRLRNRRTPHGSETPARESSRARRAASMYATAIGRLRSAPPPRQVRAPSSQRATIHPRCPSALDQRSAASIRLRQQRHRFVSPTDLASRHPTLRPPENHTVNAKQPPGLGDRSPGDDTPKRSSQTRSTARVLGREDMAFVLRRVRSPTRNDRPSRPPHVRTRPAASRFVSFLQREVFCFALT